MYRIIFYHMITIFHGDNQDLSRAAFIEATDKLHGFDILQIDAKTADENQISQFLNSLSFISASKAVCFTNFFSIPKAKLDKIIPVLTSTSNIAILIWQEKQLTAVQLKPLPLAKIELFKTNNVLYFCLNQIKPKNLAKFISYYHQVVDNNLYDLFLYLLKNNLRKKLLTYSPFNPEIIKKTYLQLIELDYLNKSGNLAISKEIALERLMIKLLS